MSFKDYVKERTLFLLINGMLFVTLSGIMILMNVSVNIILLVFCLWFLPLLTYIFVEFMKQKTLYEELHYLMESLDRKYLLSEIMEKPESIEGKMIYDLLQQANKDMHEHVKKYRDMQSDYREYIDTWVHEIKTPIASTRLMIENNQNDITRSIQDEMKKIEEYIEQVLYYSRSNDVSKDYIIKERSLEPLVRSVIKKNARDFISKSISIDIDKVNATVYSDVKWLGFILNQVIGNAIKYIRDGNGKVTISTSQNENNIILSIKDNGIGIIENDINRVFEKGFTGENGRKYGKSTGIGLYLCKKLATQLGLGLTLSSEAGKGTEVRIIFPLGNVHLLNG